MVFNGDVPGEGGGICHDDIVSYNAIVSHVAVSHKKIVVPNDSDSVPSFGPAIQSDKFSKDIVAADLQIGGLACVFEVLWIGSNGAVAVETAPLSYLCPTMNRNMGIQFAAAPYTCMGTDNAVWPDVSFRGNLAGFVYNRSRVYGHWVKKGPE